jgi:hypothetical protein
VKSITWGRQFGHSTSQTRDIAVALAEPFIWPKAETPTLFFEQKYFSGGVRQHNLLGKKKKNILIHKMPFKVYFLD